MDNMDTREGAEQIACAQKTEVLWTTEDTREASAIIMEGQKEAGWGGPASLCPPSFPKADISMTVTFKADEEDRCYQRHSCTDRKICFEYLYIVRFAEILQTSGFPTGDVPFNTDLTTQRQLLNPRANWKVSNRFRPLVIKKRNY